MNLFQLGTVKLASGQESDFKIECDALTDEDIECLAYLISKRVKFYRALGVPSGGIRLARALDKYESDDNSLPFLIVDDVLTTGKSMEQFVEAFLDVSGERKWVGFVIFARNYLPSGVEALFKMY